MTSHCPSFPLLPHDGTGNSEWMSRHHGVCTCTMLTNAVAGSLHRHDVLDKGLIVHTAILILLSCHEGINLRLIHLLSQC